MGRTWRAAAATAIGGGVVLVATGAFGLWSPGTFASAHATTPEPITVLAQDGPADLYPGFDGGDLTFRLKNPNPFPMTVRSMAPAGVTSADPAACPAANITVRPAGGLTLSVAARSTSGPLSIPGVVSMATSAPEGCQGVGFTIDLTVAADQAGGGD